MSEAIVKWVDVKDGGRKPIPSGTRYSPLIVLEGMDKTEAWSSDFICTETVDGEMVVEIAFLVEKAPEHLLVAGAKFQLYEGRTLVATGVIV